MAGRWASSVKESVGCGAARSGAAARSTGSPGSGCVATSTAGFRPRMFATRTLGRASTSSPKAGARCGNAARRDLCRGLWVTMIPTATIHWIVTAEDTPLVVVVMQLGAEDLPTRGQAAIQLGG